MPRRGITALCALGGALALALAGGASPGMGRAHLAHIRANQSYTTGPTGPTGPSGPTGPHPSTAWSIASKRVDSAHRIIIKVNAAAAPAGYGATAAFKLSKYGRTITYGSASASSPGSGTVTLTIKPSKAAKSALTKVRKLVVTVLIQFVPKNGALSPAVDRITMTVNGKSKGKPKGKAKPKPKPKGKAKPKGKGKGKGKPKH